jgi:hypothetical protein
MDARARSPPRLPCLPTAAWNLADSEFLGLNPIAAIHNLLFSR